MTGVAKERASVRDSSWKEMALDRRAQRAGDAEGTLEREQVEREDAICNVGAATMNAPNTQEAQCAVCIHSVVRIRCQCNIR